MVEDEAEEPVGELVADAAESVTEEPVADESAAEPVADEPAEETAEERRPLSRWSTTRHPPTSPLPTSPRKTPRPLSGWSTTRLVNPWLRHSWPTSSLPTSPALCSPRRRRRSSSRRPARLTRSPTCQRGCRLPPRRPVRGPMPRRSASPPEGHSPGSLTRNFSSLRPMRIPPKPGRGPMPARIERLRRRPRPHRMHTKRS